MNIRVSKEFEKSAKKLSGKYKETLKQTILEIKFAQTHRCNALHFHQFVKFGVKLKMFIIT